MSCKVLIATTLLLIGARTAAGANGAQFISQSTPTTMVTGSVRSVSITLKNSGTTTWTAAAGHRLGSQNPQDNTTWGTGRVDLAAGESIVPGQQKTFTFNITAPATPGNYNFQWRMLQEGVEWFGDFTPTVLIQVTTTPVDAATFVSQSVPATLNTGEVRSVSVTMNNSGSSTWTRAANYALGSQSPQDNTTWGTGRVQLGTTESIVPGQQKTFTFNITAPATPGLYDFQWRMVHEGVAWFGQFTTRVSINVVQTVTLCPGVTVVADGSTDAAPALQQCIDNTASGGTLSIPAATYGMASQVFITKPMTLRTSGTSGSTQSCDAIPCARLKATPAFNVGNGGFLVVQSTHDVTLDHLILDGNRAARLSTTAASQCAGGSNVWGFNARMSDCAFCRFTWNISENALCGSAMEFRGDDGTLTNNIIRNNGQNSANNMWSDGITIHFSDRAIVTGNTLINNSDVSLILGGARNAQVTNNSLSQPGQVCFAAFSIDNFGGGTHGDFTGTIISGNTIDCSAARNCHFGMNLGSHVWGVAPNTLGGTITGNTVVNARQGVIVDGGGTAASPMTLYGNNVSGSPSSATFNCGTRATSNLNIYTPHSVVNRNGDTTPATNNQWHSCP
jgi:parallel beta-helix repeat protein